MVLNGREFMKKFLTLAVAAAVLSATVSALTFKVDGYARAGLTSTLNTKNKDGDKLFLQNSGLQVTILEAVLV